MCYFHGHVVFCTHRFISYAYAHTDKPDELDRVNNACIIIIISVHYHHYQRQREREEFFCQKGFSSTDVYKCRLFKATL